MEYYNQISDIGGADIMVVPCEQVTQDSGKKKRRRALKMSIKHSKAMAKQENKQYALLSSVTIGDEKGLDTYEMREYIKEVV